MQPYLSFADLPFIWSHLTFPLRSFSSSRGARTHKRRGGGRRLSCRLLCVCYPFSASLSFSPFPRIVYVVSSVSVFFLYFSFFLVYFSVSAFSYFRCLSPTSRVYASPTEVSFMVLGANRLPMRYLCDPKCARQG